MHFRRSSFVFATVMVAAAIFAACGSDDGGGGGGSSSGTSGTSSGSSGSSSGSSGGSSGSSGSSGGLDGQAADSEAGDAAEDAAPIVKKEFPTGTPSIGGYTLVDAYPGIVFDIPAAIAWAKSGSGPYVLERTGQIRTIVGATRPTLLDFSAQVHIAGEGGALGLVLHPKFLDPVDPHNYVYVWYNAKPSTQRLQRYTWNTGTNTFDPASVVTMIEEQEFEVIHNAGKLNFGPDGFLYFGNGDDNTLDNHQTITNAMFAGIFRIDVDQDPLKSHAPPLHTPVQPKHNGLYTRTGYGIPNDNPFVGVANAVEEFYALGFRNPFSFSFDRMTGKIWMGDVGDSFREEVNQVDKGANYGWPVMEGELTSQGGYTKTLLAGSTATAPKHYYTHSEQADIASIFGGYVYRGPGFPELNGQYIFTDWPSNRLWALDISKSPAVRKTLYETQYKLQPMGLGEDNNGELYILQYGPDKVNDLGNFGGRIKKLAKDTTAADLLPKRLVETTLFDDVATLKPAANLIPYEVSSPLWSDGAAKQRWIRLPAGQKATYDATEDRLTFPVGTVFVKQFDLPSSVTPVGRSRRLETRVMIVGDKTTWGYTFRWNPAGTDATLVSEQADETITDMVTNTTRNWHFMGFGQCWGCHRDDASTGTAYRKDKWRILGFSAAQLGVVIGGVDQRTMLATKGVFDAADVANMPPVIPNPSDTTQTAETRAYAYLAANCSPCHHEGASYTGGGQTWLATYGSGTVPQRHMDQTTNNYPMSVRLANEMGVPQLAGGVLVKPGQPSQSLLLARIKTNDPDLRMPPIARNVPDDNGAAIVQAWIQGLTP